jgi:hypothetical protein
LTEANGIYSHASGLGTKANGDAQTVVGMYNKDDPNAKFIVGAGYSYNRQNAFTAGNDGTNKYITVGDSKFTETDLNNIKDQYARRIEELERKLGDVEAALDAILKMQEDLTAKTLTFTYIDNDINYTHYTLEFKEGMTWAEWCSSEYNTVELYINEEQSNNVYKGVAVVSDITDSTWPSGEQLIKADHTYQAH